MAMVARLREPFGLPEFPEANRPAVFLPFFMCYNITYLNLSTTGPRYCPPNTEDDPLLCDSPTLPDLYRRDAYYR